MKKLISIMFLLIIIPIISKGQIFRKKTLDDAYVGYFSSGNTQIGIGFHIMYGYFQAKISTQYHPDNHGWDLSHVHEIGAIFDLTKELQLLAGSGYTVFERNFDGKKPLFSIQYKYLINFNTHLALRMDKLKFILGWDISNKTFDYGILINFN